MYAIVAVALASLTAAYALFYWSQTGPGWGTTNNGEFVSPMVTVQDLGWRGAKGVVLDPEHWWLWHVDTGCDSDCVKVAHDLRAIHTLLNKDARRVRIGFTDLAHVQANTRDHATVGSDQLGKPILINNVGSQLGVDIGIYIVDPIGNLVLYYAQGTDPGLILEDLKRLLKVSQIG
jgi:hypothetical protein